MTDEEWLAAYLLRFGTATIANARVQEGEAKFLIDMERTLSCKGGKRSAWAVIRETYERSLYGERTPKAKRS